MPLKSNGGEFVTTLWSLDDDNAHHTPGCHRPSIGCSVAEPGSSRTGFIVVPGDGRVALDASCGRPRILFGHESIASGGDQLRSGDDVKTRLLSSGPLIFKSD